MTDRVVLTLTKGTTATRIPGRQVGFSARRCFQFDDSAEDAACSRRLADYLLAQPRLAIYGQGRLTQLLFKHAPELRRHVRALLVDRIPNDGGAFPGMPLVTVDEVDGGITTVFLADEHAVERTRMRSRLDSRLTIIEPTVLADIAAESVPTRAWVPISKNIYPIDLPEIRFDEGLDLLLIDCPARNLALMPNGLAYVHNAFKKTAARFRTFDLDIIAYHRFHIQRIFDEGGQVILASGRELPVDPWQAENYDLWSEPEVIDFFMPIIHEAAAAIIEARPKLLGLSIQQCSEAFSAELVRLVKAARPETVILVGGFSCYSPDIGLRSFPLADYMCIGESDLTVGPLVEALARGERPIDLPGVLSRYDTPARLFTPAPMPHNLDQIDPPTYEWFDLDLYRNFNDYQLTPIIASRGCRWSRCTFCAERFYWRIRSATNFVDELEWLVDRGCTLFMFNESDLNGMPEKLLEICEEIIRRGLNIKLTGQLRIHKKSDRAFFDTLRKAGFVALRFGVDAFSENTLRLQKKGYTTEMISQNLKDCWEAGIFTEVNWVIGVPGETDADVEEGIDLIIRNREYIGRLANIDPLILVNGSVYWIDPESHGIRFRAPQEELYAAHARAIPADMWYSVDPYIDAQVRKSRFERIVLGLHDAGFPVGPWAQRIIEDVRLHRDKNRAGSSEAAAPAEAEAEAEDVAPVAAEPPRPERVVVRQTATHSIVRSSPWYYAVPIDVDVAAIADDALDALPGVLRSATKDGALEAVELVFDWAGSRGHYDVRKHQRVAGSYLRADSL